MVFDRHGVFRLHFVFGFADDYVPLKMTALRWMGTATTLGDKSGKRCCKKLPALFEAGT
jgi:hypothetical protein